MELTTILMYVMSIFYFTAGVTHFTHTKFFLRIVPAFLPYHKAIVYISGVAEIVLAIGLIPEMTRIYAAWGIILLLIAVFPANIYQLVSDKARMKIPKWSLVLRLPMQFVLIYWAWIYTH
ncbi:DoxX family protein [Leptospira sp. GIMC2001]|uniref:DoxX family protein n=1 Tax=Leptospira sp. GIMC2001 TaxID=1513297 RepID=UPI002349D2E5|nr:DoxX-like family protein [Leptospira sp. GIMC2001]WCL49041.1 DoxX-like family protein [Leptospira sp. GIMC2001]